MLSINDIRLLEAKQKSKFKQVTVQNTEKSLEKFFPYLYHSMVGQYQMVLPALAAPDRKTQKLWRQHVRGLKMDIYGIMSPSPNAFTIPGIPSKNVTFLGLMSPQFPVLFYLATYFAGAQSLKSMTGKMGDKGIVQISAPKEIRVRQWITKGLRGMLEPREQVAVCLHEVGHWARAKPIFAADMFNVTRHLLYTFAPITFIINPVFAPLMKALEICGMMIGRQGEYAADNFVKQCGYGEELKRALEKIHYRKRENINILGKIEDLYMRVLTRVQNVVEKVLPMGAHPSYNRRVAALTDHDMMLYENMITDKLESIMVKLLAPLDEFFAKHVDILQPYGKH